MQFGAINTGQKGEIVRDFKSAWIGSPALLPKGSKIILLVEIEKSLCRNRGLFCR